MTVTTLPNSATAMQPFAESGIREEPVFVIQATGGERLPLDVNATTPRHQEGPGYASAWLSRLSLACFLAIREVEFAHRPSNYCIQLVREGNATDIAVRSSQDVMRQEILSSIEALLREDLEDGMTYELGTRVISIVNQYREVALAMLADSILSGEILAGETASHVLRWLGRIGDPATESSRLRVLSRGLQAASPTVRDGAALGMAALCKQEAIPMLRRAVREERIPSLRRDLEQVLRELEHPR